MEREILNPARETIHDATGTVRRRCAVGLFAIVVVISGRADAVNLNPAGAAPLHSHRYFTTASPDAIESGSLWLGTSAGLSNAPLACRIRNQTGVAVASAATATTLVGGAVDWLHASLAIPAMVADATWTPGTQFCPAPDTNRKGIFWGVNDPIVNVSALVFSSQELSVALRATGTVPVMGLMSLIWPKLTPVANVLGDDWGALKLTANPGTVMGPVSVAAEVGVILRPSSTVLDRRLGSGLTASGAASVHALMPGLFFIADANIRAFANFDETAPVLSSTDAGMPAEILLGVKYRLGDWGFTAGMGGALIAGPTTSDARALVSISYGGPKTLAKGPPLLDLRFLFSPTEVVESEDDLALAQKRARRRAQKRERARREEEERRRRLPPCPDYESLSDEEKLFLDPDCVPEIFDEDPYANVGIDELMCEDVVEKTMQECMQQPRTIERVFQVKFALGAARLDDADAERLKRAIETLPPHTTLVSVSITGHADALGSSGYNQVLAEQRANQVRDRVLASEVPNVHVDVRARGEQDPLVLRFDEHEGAPANRRVDVVIRYLLHPEPPPAPPPAVLVEKPKPQVSRRVLQLEPIERSSSW